MLNGDEQEPQAAPGPAIDRESIMSHWEPVFRLLYRLTRDRHDTEDLTQETFVRALERSGTFQPGSSLRAWLMRIATNAFLDLCRRRKALRFTPLEQEPTQHSVEPVARLQDQELHEAVASAVARLPETPRVVFLLRVQEEFSYAQIAQALDMSEEAARWHMMQARKRLLASLDGRLP